jgi:enoyl-CoA hydratase
MPEVKIEIEEGVATLVLDAPERRNALTPAMAREVIAACAEIDADPSVGAAVVASTGDVFCAGGDRATLRAVGAAHTDPDVIEELRAVYDAFVRVGSLRVPSIAAVQGAAVGAGLNLVLATDVRIIAHDARLLGGFQRIGIHPGGGNITLLSRVAGREAAMAMTAFGEEIDGDTAKRLGLAWDAVPAADVRARAWELARRAAADPVLSRAVIETARAELGPPGVSWGQALELEVGPQLRSLSRSLADGRLG